MQLPILDISTLIKGEAGFEGIAEEIRKACTETGFFYIAGHGVSSAIQDDLASVCRRFFDLDVDTKMRIRMALGGNAWRGYFKVGDELTSGKPDQKEGLYFGEELPDEDPRVQQGIFMHGKNLFPDELPDMRRAVLAYIQALTRLGHALMRGISLSLGLEESYINAHYTADPLTLFRVFRYPPVPPANNKLWGVGEHTDYGVLTILKQDDVGGLQVKAKSGWIDAPPVPDTFVCNIGDMLDRMTGGFYKSTPHRVINTSGKERYSFPFFFDPSFQTPVKPIESPLILKQADDSSDRWDKSSVHAFEGTYGDYLLNKVGKVFPDLMTR